MKIETILGETMNFTGTGLSFTSYWTNRAQKGLISWTSLSLSTYSFIVLFFDCRTWGLKISRFAFSKISYSAERCPYCWNLQKSAEKKSIILKYFIISIYERPISHDFVVSGSMFNSKKQIFLGQRRYFTYKGMRHTSPTFIFSASSLHSLCN